MSGSIEHAHAADEIESSGRLDRRWAITCKGASRRREKSVASSIARYCSAFSGLFTAKLRRAANSLIDTGVDWSAGNWSSRHSAMDRATGDRLKWVLQMAAANSRGST